MRGFLLLLVLYMVAVFETSLSDLLRVGAVGPDLLTLVAIVWMLGWGGPRAFLVAGLIGLLGDLLVLGRPGIGMALLLLIGYGIVRGRARMPLEHPAGQVAVVWLGTTLLAVGLALAHWILDEASLPLPTLLLRSLGVGLYTAGMAVPVLLVIGWMREPLELRRNRPLELVP